VLGAIALTDIVKGGMKERFDHLPCHGIRTMMITVTIADRRAIARQAGVDDFLAEAKPEDKMALIKRSRRRGSWCHDRRLAPTTLRHFVRRTVGVAMNTGTQAAKEGRNMSTSIPIRRNSSKSLKSASNSLITRGALTTFSVANDVAKYFAIIPACSLLRFLNSKY